MSQKMPKLPQLDLAVHGFGYLEENYGKRHFGFSEIPPEVGICDSFLMHFGFYFGFITLEHISDGICDAAQIIFQIYYFRTYFGWYL